MDRSKSLSALTKELDEVFAIFIKLRDSENGRVKCFICGVSIPWKQAHNGHYVSRAKMATRYHELNCHGICITCNVFDEMHQMRYEDQMIIAYGIDFVVHIEALGRSLQKFMRSDLMELIEKYKIKVSALKRQKGL